MSAATESRPVIVVAHPGADLYGSDRVLVASVRSLARAGWRVVVTLPGPGPLVPLLEEAGAEVSFCPSAVLRKSALRPTGFARLLQTAVVSSWASWRLLRRVRPQVVYVNTVTLPLWILLGRVLALPVVCHVHEAEGSASRVLRSLLAVPVRLATHVVVNSEYSAGVLWGAAPGVAQRTTMVPNAVPGPRAPVPMPEEPRQPLRLGYIGRLSPRKGVDVVISALVALREQGCPTSLTVVGAVFPGYEWYEEQLRLQVRSLGLDDSVTFRGFVPDVWPELEALDVLVVPSRYDEPFGNTAVEAVLASRPVVVSATSGLIEAVDGYRLAHHFPPGDAMALAAAVLSARLNWGALRAAAASDVARATQRHSTAAYGARIVQVVDSLVERRSPRRQPAPEGERWVTRRLGPRAAAHRGTSSEIQGYE